MLDVAAPQPDRFERQVHGRRAGVDRDRVPGADGGRELGLEPAGLRPGGNPAGRERLLDLVELRIVDVPQGEWQKCFAHDYVANRGELVHFVGNLFPLLTIDHRRSTMALSSMVYRLSSEG